MISSYAAQAFLNWTVGKTAMPALPTVYVALFTVVGAEDGTGFTEVTGGSYARIVTSGATWNASSGSSPSTISNNATITFATATASWGTVIGFGAYDASSGGNLLFFDYLGSFNWLPFTVSSASPGVITTPAHGFSAADPVIASTVFGGTFPTFSQSNFTGTLLVVSPATDTFTVTNGGTAVNTSSTGDGMIRKIVQQSVPTGVQPSFAGGSPGALVASLS